jgi:hypothetical protein
MVYLFWIIKRKISKLVFALGFLVIFPFYLYLTNVNFKENTNLDINSNFSKKQLEYYIVFEKINAFNCDKETNFFLISPKIINHHAIHNPKCSIIEKDVFNLISLLYKSKAFVLDLNLIKNIKLKDSRKSINDIKSNENIKINTFKFLKDISVIQNNNKNETIYISYGIFYRSFYNLNKVLRENLDQNKFYLNYTFSFYENEKILTGVHVGCTVLLIQIQIVYERGNFLWIGANDFNKFTFFGDTPRALKK